MLLRLHFENERAFWIALDCDPALVHSYIDPLSGKWALGQSVWGADAGIRTRSQLCLELREATERSRWALIARWWISLLLFNSALIAGLPGGWDALISVAEDPDPDYPPPQTPSTTETVRRSVEGLKPSPLSHLGMDFFFVWKRGDQTRLGGILLDLKELKGAIASILEQGPLPHLLVYISPKDVIELNKAFLGGSCRSCCLRSVKRPATLRALTYAPN